jgi:hypothetical protein
MTKTQLKSILIEIPDDFTDNLVLFPEITIPTLGETPTEYLKALATQAINEAQVMAAFTGKTPAKCLLYSGMLSPSAILSAILPLKGTNKEREFEDVIDAVEIDYVGEGALTWGVDPAGKVAMEGAKIEEIVNAYWQSILNVSPSAEDVKEKVKEILRRGVALSVGKVWNGEAYEALPEGCDFTPGGQYLIARMIELSLQRYCSLEAPQYFFSTLSGIHDILTLTNNRQGENFDTFLNFLYENFAVQLGTQDNETGEWMPFLKEALMQEGKVIIGDYVVYLKSAVIDTKDK